MTNQAPRAPKALDSAGRALWRAIVGQVSGDGLVLDARELSALAAACAEADMLATLEEALADQPRTVKGAQGQLVAHPLIGEARRSRQTVASLLKSIGLEDPILADAKSGRGSRTTSWQARDAANARHQAR